MDKFLLQSRFQQLHKVRIDQPTTGLEARKEEIKEHRKSTRNNLMALKRNIKAEMSPFQEDEPPLTKKQSTLEKKMEEKRQQLKLWQQEKKKRLQLLKLQSKPLFKYHHVTVPLGAPDLENINKEIKGKRFTTKKDTTNLSSAFAQFNYKFKGTNSESLKTKHSTLKPLKNQETTNRVLFTDDTYGNESSGMQYKKTPAKNNNRNKKKQVEQLHTASPTIATRLRSKLTFGCKDDKTVQKAISTSSKKGKSQQDIDLNKENEMSGKKQRKKSTKIDSVNEKSLKKIKTLTAPSPVAEESYRKTPRKERKSVLVELNTNSPEKNENVKTQEVSTSNKGRRKNNKSVVKEKATKKTRKLIRNDAIDEDSDQQTPAKHRKSAVINSPEEIEHQEDSTNEALPKTPGNENGTPQNRNPASEEAPLAYVSPFVTITRGKHRARKEFQLRSSQAGLFDVSPEMKKATGTDAAVAYFHRLVDDEIERIQGLCDTWTKYKDEENPPEDACDMINVAVGQSQLLINKKFKQFRGLINDCETGDADPPITCTDLHGYWDTAYIQVDNLDKRFDNLDKLKNNKWEEILASAKKDQTQKVVAKRGRKPKAKATSSLRELIKAQRRKAATEQPEEGSTEPSEMENATMVTPSKPVRSVGRPRNSLRTSVLTSEASKRVSSPGLIILKVAHTARSVEKRADLLCEGTPGRSILKPHNSKSTTKKSVLFKEVHNGEISPELEDSGRRKSRRLTGIKLFS